MFRKRKKILAQSTLEYAVLIVLVAVALIATQTYIKRAMQGRLRSAADDIGEQFSPSASEVNVTINSDSRSRELTVGGVTSSRLLEAELTNRTTNISVEAFDSNNEFWAPCDGDGACEAGENHATCPADCP